MDTETTSPEASIVPMIVATAVVTVAAVMAANGIYQVVSLFRKNAADKKLLEEIRNNPLVND